MQWKKIPFAGNTQLSLICLDPINSDAKSNFVILDACLEYWAALTTLVFLAALVARVNKQMYLTVATKHILL